MDLSNSNHFVWVGDGRTLYTELRNLLSACSNYQHAVTTKSFEPQNYVIYICYQINHNIIILLAFGFKRLQLILENIRIKICVTIEILKDPPSL